VASSATSVFQPEPTSLVDVRSFVTRACEQWHLDPDDLALVVLVAGELATNAVLHGRSRYELTVSHRPGTVRIEVHDTNPRLPRLAETLPTLAQSGLGLRIVERTSRSWGAAADGTGGKCVWAEVAVTD
jgi:anti-sigma regulatory factor (Ser/Thr protein kinase)